MVPIQIFIQMVPIVD